MVVLLVASVVNLHHFVLDGAIWKLRDGRVARVLLRTAEGPGETGVGAATTQGSPALGRSLAGSPCRLESGVETNHPWEARSIFALGALEEAAKVAG